MAKAKIIELGTVVKVHASCIVETDKGKMSQIKAEKGDVLLMDVSSRKVSIKTASTRNKQIEPQNTQLNLENESNTDSLNKE